MIERRYVFYTVRYRAEVAWDSEKGDEQDALSDVDIPEGGKNDSTYVENSFEVTGWENR